MLAQNFKSAPDLGITTEGHTALIQVLAMLERGELTSVGPCRTHLPNGFNMSRVWHESDCGSVGCIKGWCQHITKNPMLFNLMGSDPVSRPLIQLFMYADDRRFKVTADQAASALRNYLTLGDARWDEILGAEGH